MKAQILKGNLFICLSMLILICLLNSCKKDDENVEKSQQTSNIPTSIYGTYSMSVINNTTSANSINTWDILPNNSTSVLIVSSFLGDTIVMNVNNNVLEIPAQTFPNSGWVGGTYTISGTGNYSDPQIVLSFGKFFSATSTSYSYSATGVRQ